MPNNRMSKTNNYEKITHLCEAAFGNYLTDFILSSKEYHKKYLTCLLHQN